MAPPRSAVAAKLQKEQDDLLPSEDEDDEDFTLEDGEGDDGGSDSSDSEREQGPVSKRAKVDEVQSEQPALDKSAVDDLWASFNDPGVDPYASTSSTPNPPVHSTSHSTSASASTSTPALKNVSDVKKGKGKANLDQSELVTIKVTYKFAGDTITQDKKVPKDSQEARDYFALHPEANGNSSVVSPAPSLTTNPSDPTSSSLDALFGPESTTASPTIDPKPSASVPSSSSASPAPPSKPPSIGTGAPPPKRKKAGGGLGAMAASLGVGGKPAKLNTLEKSKLDWNQYVQGQDGLGDTLEHARKDGYLEKKDFLDRVEMRKEEGWEKGRKKGGR